MDDPDSNGLACSITFQIAAVRLLLSLVRVCARVSDEWYTRGTSSVHTRGVSMLEAFQVQLCSIVTTVLATDGDGAAPTCSTAAGCCGAQLASTLVSLGLSGGKASTMRIVKLLLQQLQGASGEPAHANLRTAASAAIGAVFVQCYDRRDERAGACLAPAVVQQVRNAVLSALRPHLWAEWLAAVHVGPRRGSTRRVGARPRAAPGVLHRWVGGAQVVHVRMRTSRCINLVVSSFCCSWCIMSSSFKFQDRPEPCCT